jgi:hypothetical protein
MGHKWPPPRDRQGDYTDDAGDMRLAAARISHTRLTISVREHSLQNPDQPYEELWDKTTWRLTNGSRRQVGLMTTARLNGLVMNDCGAMRGSGASSTCPCCGAGYDNLQHALLTCSHPTLRSAQSRLQESLARILKPGQYGMLQSLDDHEKKMFLLGKQMHARLDRTQERELDLAMKHFLEYIDDWRTTELELNPMCGRTYTSPPEESLQQRPSGTECGVRNRDPGGHREMRSNRHRQTRTSSTSGNSPRETTESTRTVDDECAPWGPKATTKGKGRNDQRWEADGTAASSWREGQGAGMTSLNPYISPF